MKKIEDLFRTEILYEGTRITIDGFMFFFTGGQIALGGLLLVYGEIYPALALMLLAGLPFLHEAGHYLIAREHGFDVSAVSFQNHRINTVIEGNLTHKDIMDIAFAGEMSSGYVYALVTLCIYLWGLSANTPFIYLFIIVPAVWVLSWTKYDSDFRVGWRAYQYHNAQQGKDSFGGIFP